MHPEGGSWTSVRTHTPSKFSKVLTEPLAPIPLDYSKFRENGSQPSPNRACNFHCTRLSILVLTSATYLVSVSIRMTTFRSGTQGLSLFPSASDFRPCYHVLYLG